MKHPKRYMADGTATTRRVRGVEKVECEVHPKGCYAVLTSWAGDPIPRRNAHWHIYLLSQSKGVGMLDLSRELERETPQLKAGIRSRVMKAEGWKP